MSEENRPGGGALGRATVIAALMVGIAIVGGSYFVATALDQTTEQVRLTRAALAKLPQAAAAAPSRPSRNRPDPDKRYEIALGTAPVKGEKDAVVTIVEWSDFQCPFCARVGTTLTQIEENYEGKVKIAFKHLPLGMHPKAPAAHAASEAAHNQGKFWEMHDLMFANQRALSPEKYEEWAQELGLDMERFKRDSASPAIKKKVDADAARARALGITGTPAFFINGRYLSGAQPYARFKQIIDEELAGKKS